MARTWLSIRVELVSGMGAAFWPRPGRIFAAAGRHTFADLARAVDTAFARWDHAHLNMFTLDDDTEVTPIEWWDGEEPFDTGSVLGLGRTAGPIRSAVRRRRRRH